MYVVVNCVLSHIDSYIYILNSIDNLCDVKLCLISVSPDILTITYIQNSIDNLCDVKLLFILVCISYVDNYT